MTLPPLALVAAAIWLAALTILVFDVVLILHGCPPIFRIGCGAV